MNFRLIELDSKYEFSTLVYNDKVDKLVLRSNEIKDPYNMFDIQEINYTMEQYRKFIWYLACKQNPILSPKIEIDCSVSKKSSGKYVYYFEPVVSYVNTIKVYEETTPIDDTDMYSYEYIKKPVPVMFESSLFSNFEFYDKYSFLDPQFYVRNHLILLSMFDFMFENASAQKYDLDNVFSDLKERYPIEIIDTIPFIRKSDVKNNLQFPSFYIQMNNLTTQKEHDGWYAHMVPNFLMENAKEMCGLWKIEIHPVSFGIKNEATIIFVRFSKTYVYPFDNYSFDITLIDYLNDKTIPVVLYVNDIPRFTNSLLSKRSIELVNEFLNLNPNPIIEKNNIFSINGIEMFCLISNLSN
jgi:hypothetical protein